MSASEPRQRHQRPAGPPPQSDGREQLGQLLRHAFPIGEDHSFAGVLDALRTAPEEVRLEPPVTLPPV